MTAPDGFVELVDALLCEGDRTLSLLDRAAVAGRLPEAVRVATGADMGVLGETDSPDLLVLRRLAGNVSPALQDLHVPSGFGIGGKALALGRPCSVTDYVVAPTITHDFDRPVMVEGLRSLLTVPVSDGTTTYGVLYACSRDVVEFGDIAIGRLEAVARIAAAQLAAAAQARRNQEVAAQAERQRMSVELHDSLGAMLFTIAAHMHAVRADYPDGDPLAARLEALENQIGEAGRALRECIREMHTVADGRLLPVAVHHDCEALRRRTGLAVTCLDLGTVPDLDPDRHDALVAFTREALLNVEKHAAASNVVVTVAAHDGAVQVTVVDDGLGIGAAPTSAASSGLGLAACADRLGRVGGGLAVRGNDDRGVTVRGWIPVR